MDEETECAFCGRGASQPILILGHSLCPECEGRLVELNADDPDYPTWLAVLRGIWAKWAESL